MKEISYIYVEGYFVVEMKYGLIVLVDEYMLSVFVMLWGFIYDKVMLNLEEIKV